VNRLKLITIQKKMAPVSVKKPTEETLGERISIDREEVPVTARVAQTLATTAQKPAEKAPDAMDIDPRASSSLADTQQPPKSPDV
jgi:hypothetical protein